MTTPLRLLFLCTGNSCRSQMAEGWARHLKNDRFDVRSAGLEPHGLNPYAVTVMREAGVDISDHRSQHVDAFADEAFDVVVTVCDHAHEACPLFPGHARIVHRGFDDPPHLARGLHDQDAILACYRRVRDEIRDFVAGMPESLDRAASA